MSVALLAEPSLSIAEAREALGDEAFGLSDEEVLEEIEFMDHLAIFALDWIREVQKSNQVLAIQQ